VIVTGTFLLALVVGAVLHLDLPSARRVAVKELNKMLAPSFTGTITVDDIGGLGIVGARGVTLHVDGADGKRLIYAHDARIGILPFRAARSALFGKGDVHVDVGIASVDYVEANLDTDDKGSLEIAHAFDPRTPTPAPTPGRGLRLSFPRVTLRHGWVHGVIAGAPPVDAELDRVEGALLVASDVTRIDVNRLVLRTRALPMEANPGGDVEAHVTIPSEAGKDTSLTGLFQGAVGGIPATAIASMAGTKVDAVLDVPPVSSARVRAFMAEAPVYDTVSGHAEVHGLLSNLHATGLFGVGHGRITIDGHASVGDDTQADARIDATNIDARTFTPSGPHSDLGMVADLHVHKPKMGALTAGFSVQVPVGSYGDQLVPTAHLGGNVSWNADASRGAVGIGGRVSGRIDEAGAPITIEAEAQPSSAGEQMTFDVQADVRHLDAFRRFGDLGPGRARLEANGKLVLASPLLVDAAVHAQLDGLARGDESVTHAEVKVLARGPISNPALKTSMDADGIRFGTSTLAHVSVAADGLLDNQDVMVFVRGEKNVPSLEGHATIKMNHGVTIRSARAWASREGAMVALRVGEVRIGEGEIVIQDAELDGLGSTARASLRKSSERLLVHASAEKLDLKRLGYVLRMENMVKDGQLAFDIDFDAQRSGARGHATLKANHVCVPSVDEGSVDIDVKMGGREVAGDMRIAVKDIAVFDVRSGAVHIGGQGPLESGAWRKAWGDVTFSARADLGKLAAMVPADRLPVTNVSGKFTMNGRLARDSESDDTPEISLSAATRGLVLGTKGGAVEHRGKIEVIAPPRSRTMGVDAQLDVRVDGTTGFAEVATRMVDKHGAIVGIDAKSAEVPYKELMASFDGATERLAKVPFSMTVAVPDRKLEELPPWLPLPGTSGTIDGTVNVTGTANRPKVSGAFRGHSLRVSGMTPGMRLDADIDLSYDGETCDLGLHVRSPEEEVLVASAHMDAKVDGAILGQSEINAWIASAKGTLKAFPLAALGPLSDRQVNGHLSGDFSLDDLHKDARALLNLKIDDLEVGTAKFKSGFAKVSLDDKGLDASARLDQKDGFAEVRAKVGMTWGSNVSPTADSNGTTEVVLNAKRFRLVTLLPFLQDQLSELDGAVDANARFSVAGGGKPSMQGGVTWSDGLLQVNALGEEFHAIRATVSLSPDGVVRLTDMSLSGPSGRMLLAGTARLDGLALTSADATLKIEKKQAVPLDVSGTSFGRIYGDIAVKAQASPDQKTMTVAVDIPTLHVELPLTPMSSVQDLGKPKEEHVGYFSSPNRFIVLPVDGGEMPVKPKPHDDAASSVMEVKVKFGKDVEVRRGTTLKVVLDGGPEIKVGEETVVRGQIRLKSGSLNVQGKKFDIEKGTVSFVGKDASNPEVSVTAAWTAEDGTRVYADFIGPLKTGKVTLRSEPPRPKNEIVALILFGTADGSQSTPYASPAEDNATRVGTTAGGFATEGLSKGLDQLTGMEITTKIDTSDSANPRPEVEMQIAKDISVQLAFVLGTPPPGTNPDTTYASIDWRFIHNWSLETTFGNLGSTIADVVWQYRY
jgi:translocation and assembly module TamB